jgi:hypothetical protein
MADASAMGSKVSLAEILSKLSPNNTRRPLSVLRCLGEYVNRGVETMDDGLFRGGKVDSIETFLRGMKSNLGDGQGFGSVSSDGYPSMVGRIVTTV